MECKECNKICKNATGLSRHLIMQHDMNTFDYTIKHFYNGEQPKCCVVGCNNVPRYVSFKFKKHCKEHFMEAAAAGGRNGRR